MDDSSHYTRVVADLAERLAGLSSPGPALRVAIDGQTAAGKTSFAAALVLALKALGRPAEGAELDGFHNPRAVRWAKGRASPLGYYEDARDLAAVRRLLLDPLGPGGDGRYATASFDLAADAPLDPDWRTAPEGLVLVFDGSFLQKPALRPGLDVVIFLEVPDALAAKRGAARDRAMLGDQAEALYRDRYAPAFRLYRAEVDPIAGADAVVDMSDFETPVLQIKPGGALFEL